MAKKIGMFAARHQTTVFQTVTSIGLHFAVAFGVMFAFTGQAVIAGAVALVEPVACHFAHRVHDWAWEMFEQKPAFATLAATDDRLASA